MPSTSADSSAHAGITAPKAHRQQCIIVSPRVSLAICKGWEEYQGFATCGPDLHTQLLKHCRAALCNITQVDQNCRRSLKFVMLRHVPRKAILHTCVRSNMVMKVYT